MELLKKLFCSCHEYLESNLNYCILTILISIFSGMIFIMFRASSANDTGIESECNNEDFVEKPGWYETYR